MNDIDEFLEKRCKNDVLRKMKNVFQLQIMRYVIKTHQKIDDLSQIYKLPIFQQFDFLVKAIFRHIKKFEIEKRFTLFSDVFING